MRRITLVVAVLFVAGWAEGLEASERSIGELPQDLWNLATVWTEPIKGAARESRRFDPISGVWFGLLEGSVKSFERTAGLVLPHDEQSSPSRPDADNPIIRYSF